MPVENVGGTEVAVQRIMRALVPTRSLLLLVGIATLDLVVTAWLHAQGRIVEMNPLMRGLIEQSEWLFALVKGATIALTWAALVWYGRQNVRFVRNASLIGSAAYVTIWTVWFVIGSR